jgi:hypothetical protein
MRGHCPTCGKPKDPKNLMDVMPDHLKKEAWLYVRHFRPSIHRDSDSIDQVRYYIVPSNSNEKLCRTNRQLHHLLKFKKACIEESDDLMAYIKSNHLTVTRCSIDICTVTVEYSSLVVGKVSRASINEEMKSDIKIADEVMVVLKSIAPNLRQLNFTCDNNSASQQLIWRKLERIRFPSVTHASLFLILGYMSYEDHIFTIDDAMFPMQAVLDIKTGEVEDNYGFVQIVFNPERRIHIHPENGREGDRVYNKVKELFVESGKYNRFLELLLR